jgi:hypothetical protein
MLISRRCKFVSEQNALGLPRMGEKIPEIRDPSLFFFFHVEEVQSMSLSSLICKPLFFFSYFKLQNKQMLPFVGFYVAFFHFTKAR